MEAASFCGGVRHKRYSGQQEQLLKKSQIPIFQYDILAFSICSKFYIFERRTFYKLLTKVCDEGNFEKI